MTRLTSSIALILTVLCSTDARGARLTAAERAAGWTMLFDGASTSSWRGYKSEGFPERGWIVDDGWLRVVEGGGGGDLITKKKYRDFEFSFEWKVAPGANSGVMYRVTEEHDAPWHSGPEMQVLDDAAHDLPATDSRTSGGLYGLYDNAAAKVIHPTGQVNTARIVSREGVVKHYLNGVKVVEADLYSDDWRARVAASKFSAYDKFGKSSWGHLCLQDHGNDVWYRNVRIRQLDERGPNEELLFDGGLKPDWRSHGEAGATTNVGYVFDGEVLRMTGSPTGYLATAHSYDDFVLRLEWRYDDDAPPTANSGVLLRLVGPDTVWPRSIEAQLRSGQAGSLLVLGGTSMTTDPERRNGIVGRPTHTNERPIGEWNNYEIIAEGDRITVIVNDEIVNQASGVDSLHGRIGLQSEGTPISFRRMRLATFRSR